MPKKKSTPPAKKEPKRPSVTVSLASLFQFGELILEFTFVRRVKQTYHVTMDSRTYHVSDQQAREVFQEFVRDHGLVADRLVGTPGEQAYRVDQASPIKLYLD